MTTSRGPRKITCILFNITQHTGWNQLYEYTADLLCLDFGRPRRAVSQVPHELTVVSTPLITEAWASALSSHPDRAFARYICNGLQFGFRIGFAYDSPLRSAPSNMISTYQHPKVVTEYLHKEVTLGRMLGPFTDPTSLPPLHFNRFGVIPKGHNTGKWRLITDLSFPKGASINDGIDPCLCSLTYSSVEEVAEQVARLGPGALLAKIDIESAYRIIPVHPQDRHLQAVRWEGKIYVDPMLPFGLRSAPKIFNAVADALNWHLQQSGIQFIRHYLDDFIIVGPPNSSQCQEWIAILDRECRALGVPIAAHKRDGPSTCLVYLGIEIDTVACHLRLPEGKLQHLHSLLQDWGDRKTCSRKELESLVGLLNHACKVVRPGRSFLRRMFDLLHAVHRPRNSTTPIRLNRGFRSDLAWWRMFVAQWNGVSFLQPPSYLPQLVVTSDASGSWGCGAWHQSSWFQLEWDHRSYSLSIAEKELIPIILAGAAWGHLWHARQVICQCDNQTVVACLQSRTSRHPGLMHLIRCLVFVEAHYCFYLFPSYINTKANHLADDLSRNNLPSFLSKVPSADRQPRPVSLPLLDLLLDPQADWISQPWHRRFRAIFRRV